MEKIARKRRAELDVPAHQYNELKEFLSADLFTVLKENKDMDLELIDSDFEVVAENPLIEKLGLIAQKNLSNGTSSTTR